MRILPLLLVLLLFPYALAEEVSIDSITQLNTTGFYSAHPSNDSTTITLTPDMLRQTGDGKVMLNVGSAKDDGNDPGGKPRPSFMGKNIVWLVTISDWWEQEMEGLSRLMDQPMTQDEIQRSEERLGALEKVIRGILSQNMLDALVKLGLLPEEDSAFLHHPGYQEVHPAHPESGKSYSVPGVVELGKKKKGSGPRITLGAGGRGGGGASGRGGGLSEGSGGSGAGSGAGGGGRQPDENSGRTKPITAGQTARKKANEVSRTLSDGTQLKAEVGRNLFCTICQDLVEPDAALCTGCNRKVDECEWANPKKTSCKGCQLVICQEHFKERLWKNKCPSCLHSFEEGSYKDVDKSYELEELEWSCAQGCGVSGTEDEMAGHILNCELAMDVTEQSAGLTLDEEPKEEAAALLTVVCGNLGCGRLIDDDSISEHEARCGYGLEKCRNKGCEQEIARIEMEKHGVQCGFAEVQCEYPGCGDYVLRQSLGEHMATCDFAEVQCDYQGCEEWVLRKELAEHQESCGFALVSCHHPGCLETVRRREQQDHEATCEMRPVDFYGYQVTEGLRRSIEAYSLRPPSDSKPSDWQGVGLAAAFSLWQLAEIIKDKPASAASPVVAEPAPLYGNCQGCGQLFDNLPLHMERCYQVNTYCELCQQPMLRERLAQHKQSFCEKNLQDCPLGCSAAVSVRDLDCHKRHDCKNREVVCSNEGCYKQLRYCELEAHSETCEKKVLTCRNCGYQGLQEKAVAHMSVCYPQMNFDGRVITRQKCGAHYPVYTSEKGSVVYIFLPTQSLVNAERPDIGMVHFGKGLKLELRLNSTGMYWSVVLGLQPWSGGGRLSVSEADMSFELDVLSMNSGELLYSYECDTSGDSPLLIEHTCQFKHTLPVDEWVVLRIRTSGK